MTAEPLTMNGIEAVETAGHRLAQLPALRRIRVGIGQVLEIRRQRRLAMHGDAVLRRGEGRGGEKPAGGETGRGRESWSCAQDYSNS